MVFGPFQADDLKWSKNGFKMVQGISGDLRIIYKWSENALGHLGESENGLKMVSKWS